MEHLERAQGSLLSAVATRKATPLTDDQVLTPVSS
jgi:hypothetical protein